MIDEASTTTDTEHAMELYAEIQSKVAEAAPLVPMAVEHLNAGMQSNVKGFGLYPGKSHYINGTYFEKAHSGIPVSGRRQKPPSACANLRYGKGE